MVFEMWMNVKIYFLHLHIITFDGVFAHVALLDWNSVAAVLILVMFFSFSTLAATFNCLSDVLAMVILDKLLLAILRFFSVKDKQKI